MLTDVDVDLCLPFPEYIFRICLIVILIMSTIIPVAMPMADTCCYCLSRGRRLVSVAQTACEVILRNIPMYVFGDVCWECTAMLKKIISFRMLVQESQRRLHDFIRASDVQQYLSSNQYSIESISNLSYSSKVTTSYPDIKVKTEPYDFLEIIFDPLQVNTPKSSDRSTVKTETSSDDDKSMLLRELLIKTTPKSTKTIKKPKRKDKKIGVIKNKPAAKNMEGKDKSEKNSDSGTSDTTPSENEKVCQRRQLSHDEIMQQREERRKAEAFCLQKHKCLPCVTWFNNQSKLDAHLKRFHNPSNQVKCVVCSQRFTTEVAWRRHYAHVHHWQYTCNLCGYVNSERKNFNSHYNLKHKTVHKCPECGVTVSTLSKLRAHRGRHGAPQPCAHCAGSYPPGMMAAHVRRHTRPLAECPVCHKLVSQDYLTKHTKMTHPTAGEAPSYCVPCDATFRTRLHYRAHLAHSSRHARREFECAHCGKKYHQKTTLTDHIMYKHFNVTVDCDLCGKSLSKSRLRAHKRRVHEKVQTPKNMVCAVCGRRFSVTKDLKDHLNTHTGERPHKCEQCGDTFRQYSALFTHRRLVHLGYTKKTKKVIRKSSGSLVERRPSGSLVESEPYLESEQSGLLADIAANEEVPATMM